MGRKFQRTIEDFTCEHCGKPVKGNGYTNHCPHCLWSKHVDINPGDRENSCHGMLEPVDAYLKNGNWHLIHKCTQCGETRNVQVSKVDSLEVIKFIIAIRMHG